MSTAEERKAKRLAKQRRRLARLCPEFALFPTAEDAKRAQWEMAFAVLRWPSTWAAIGISALIVLPLAIVLTLVLTRLGVSDFFRSALSGGLAGCVAPVAMKLVARGPARRFLRQCLLERGVPVCLHCGYDLRGQTEARCPECGKAFDPALIAGANRADDDNADGCQGDT